MTQIVSSSAPGKVILFGEHAVVYGYPAIAVAINKRVSVQVKESDLPHSTLFVPDLYPTNTFNINSTKPKPDNLEAIIFILNKLMQASTSSIEITIKSDLPPSAGLGSSAAVSVALIGSLNAFYRYNFTIDEINNIAFEAEKIQHGKPSGIDNTISAYGGGIVYIKGHKKKIQVNIDSPLVIANTLVDRKTRVLVEKVKRYYDKEPQKVKTIFEEIKRLTILGEKALIKADIDKLGELMSLNHAYLSELGVSHPKLEKVIEIFDSCNALGSKLTGAGGGGCAIGIFDDEKSAKNALKKVKDAGMEAFITTFSEKGLMYDH